MGNRIRFDGSLAAIFAFLIIGQVVNLFLPPTPIWDERLFFPVIEAFGKNYLPTLDQIRTMDSPMGPVYFMVYGLMGRLAGFSLPVMRAVHLIFACLFLFLIRHLLSGGRSKTLLIICFILNPYFLVMTAPLLYTDVLGLLFLYAGTVTYLQGKHPLITGVFWGLAICTRQLFVFMPLAAAASDLYLVAVGRSSDWKKLLHIPIPWIMFLPLFFLWGYNVNSGTFHAGAFEENTLDAFSFSFKTLAYSIVLIGIYALPVLYRRFFIRIKEPLFPLVILSIVLCVSAFPINVNRGMTYGNLPQTAGLLDIALNQMSFLAIAVVPVLLYWGLVFFYDVTLSAILSKKLFLPVSVLFFTLLETVYSYCWDKHFLAVIPAVFILSQRILDKETGFPA